MFSVCVQNIFIKYKLINQTHGFRHFRSIVRRRDGPKVIQGKIKTVTKYDDSEHIQTYKDLVKSVQDSKLGDELEIESNFLDEDYHGDVFEKCDRYYDAHLSEERDMKLHIKKKIIGRKYFKFDKETNLLTHAAKQQIRFLHSSNPLEWNYKALSECFPISEAGVKKLLKCKFILTCPEKIKAHDEDVTRKWKILKSGYYSEEISPLTQKLYEEGKLVDDYFSGNSNLPTAPPPNKKIIDLKKNEPIGEFSAIVKTYSDYEKKKLIESKENTEKQISTRDSNLTESLNRKNSLIKNASKFNVASEEYDDDDFTPEVYPSVKKKIVDNGEISFSCFKELLKEENEMKLKSKYKTEYDSFIQQQIQIAHKSSMPEKVINSENCFMKIPKYKKEHVDVMFEKKQKITKIYKYDDKVGYQYPSGKIIEGKINVSRKYYNERKFIKKGKNIYNEDGEFLCRVPT